MSKLNVDQKTIKDLLTAKKADFLIPDYQRPYAWTEEECETLWSDLFAFAFPGDSRDEFDDNEEYFLGPIVTFRNDDDKLEIIDGQQRLTTIMLLLRAFCSKFEYMQDEDSVTMHADLETCIWKTGALNKVDKTKLKIDSEVASDDDKEEFLSILSTGEVKASQTSKYAKTFKFFKAQIQDMVNKYPSYVALFVWRILNNVILLPIEAESQNTALRIFSTLNDRGLPLSDADIFKSQFYKYFSGLGRKDEFISRWKHIEVGSNSIFKPMRGTPLDELFTRYMYFRRAQLGIRDTTTQALRDFYSRDNYAMLRDEKALSDLENLLAFWQRVDACDGFSDGILRRFYVLKYAPNSMWTFFVSVWYLANGKPDGVVEDEDALLSFLDLITGFIFAYAVERPGVNALRSPVYPEMINVVNHLPVTFENYKFEREDIAARFRAYVFTNVRPITKSMLVWWAFSDKKQKLLPWDTVIEIEHIYARKRDETSPLKNQSNLEALGNKAILEKRVNIRASDYRFEDKKKHYLGYQTSKGQLKDGTDVHELVELANNCGDFSEADIEARTRKIIDSFMDYLGSVNLLK